MAIGLDSFQQHFDSGSGLIHFNNAGQAPIPDVNRDVATAWIERFRREAAHCSMEAWGKTEDVRRQIARFIGAGENEVAFATTVASAISQVAFEIPLRPGDEILTWDQEYPSNFYPWRDAAKRAGARVEQVASTPAETPASRLLEHVTDRTRVVAISWVQYQAGAVTDLAEISGALRGRHIWLVADGIQGLGVRPFSFKDSGFDVVCFGSHKWLCSGYGAAFMAVRHERFAELGPREVGAMTYGNPDTPKSFSIEPRTTAARYEPGSKAIVEILALGATLDLFESVGSDTIFREASRLSDRLRDGLRDLGFRLHCAAGPIVNFSADEKNGVVLSRCEEALRSARASYARRGPGIRLSLHGFNCDDEVDRVLAALDGITENR